jgi:hypothetical protein
MHLLMRGHGQIGPLHVDPPLPMLVFTVFYPAVFCISIKSLRFGEETVYNVAARIAASAVNPSFCMHYYGLCVSYIFD